MGGRVCPVDINTDRPCECVQRPAQRPAAARQVCGSKKKWEGGEEGFVGWVSGRGGGSGDGVGPLVLFSGNLRAWRVHKPATDKVQLAAAAANSQCRDCNMEDGDGVAGF